MKDGGERLLTEEDLGEARATLKRLTTEACRPRAARMRAEVLERLAWNYIHNLEQRERTQVLAVLAGCRENLPNSDEREDMVSKALAERKDKLGGKYALSIMALINKINNLAG